MRERASERDADCRAPDGKVSKRIGMRLYPPEEIEWLKFKLYQEEKEEEEEKNKMK